MFKLKLHLFVDFIKKHFEFTSCIGASCLFGVAGMQIFCRGTVYAKGAKGDIFMYNNTVWPRTSALCGFESEKFAQSAQRHLLQLTLRLTKRRKWGCVRLFGAKSVDKL